MRCLQDCEYCSNKLSSRRYSRVAGNLHGGAAARGRQADKNAHGIEEHIVDDQHVQSGEQSDLKDELPLMVNYRMLRRRGQRIELFFPQLSHQTR